MKSVHEKKKKKKIVVYSKHLVSSYNLFCLDLKMKQELIICVRPQEMFVRAYFSYIRL